MGRPFCSRPGTNAKGTNIETKALFPTDGLRGAVLPALKADCMGRDGAATRLLTVACAAEVLNVSENTVRALCEAKKLRHHRIGLGRGAIRIEPQALEDYLRAVRVDPAAEAEMPRKTRHAQVQQLKNLSLD